MLRATQNLVFIVKPLDIETHELGLDMSERYGFSIYDGLIIAADFFSTSSDNATMAQTSLVEFTFSPEPDAGFKIEGEGEAALGVGHRRRSRAANGLRLMPTPWQPMR